MQYITQQTLTDLGINIPADKSQDIIDHLNTTLSERIGAEIIDSLDDEKGQELVALQETNEQAVVAKWLQENVEEIEEIVQDEIEILLAEIVDEGESLQNL